jgi:hypothetical protein
MINSRRKKKASSVHLSAATFNFVYQCVTLMASTSTVDVYSLTAASSSSSLPSPAPPPVHVIDPGLIAAAVAAAASGAVQGSSCKANKDMAISVIHGHIN